MLRSRMMANHIYLDVHIQVDSFISVSEGHFISERVVQQVKSERDHVSDITVHVDHEDDCYESYDGEHGSNQHLSLKHLPEREAIEQELMDNNIKPTHLQLHYTGNKINIDLIYQEEPKELAQIKSTLDGWLKNKSWLGNYTFYVKK